MKLGIFGLLANYLGMLYNLLTKLWLGFALNSLGFGICLFVLWRNRVTIPKDLEKALLAPFNLEVDE